MKQAISPFTLNVSDEQLRDLRERLHRAVIPQELPGAQWDYGPAANFIRDLRSPMTPLSATEIQSLTEAERVRLERLQQFMAER